WRLPPRSAGRRRQEVGEHGEAGGICRGSVRTSGVDAALHPEGEGGGEEEECGNGLGCAAVAASGEGGWLESASEQVQTLQRRRLDLAGDEVRYCGGVQREGAVASDPLEVVAVDGAGDGSIASGKIGGVDRLDRRGQ